MTDPQYLFNLVREQASYRGKTDVLKEFIDAFYEEIKLSGEDLCSKDIIQIVDELQEQMWAYYDFRQDDMAKELKGWAPKHKGEISDD